jgi:hypothetical protein
MEKRETGYLPTPLQIDARFTEKAGNWGVCNWAHLEDC